MTNKYSARIVEIDPIIEEMLLLSVNGVTVRCFAGHCPSVIEVGENYSAEFEMVLPDEIDISICESIETRVEMLDDGFSCEIHGRLEGDTFKSFVEFADQDIHFDFPHLNGQFVKITAHRIDVSFRGTGPL
ncbi:MULTISPECIES: hypothetical protein [unclassified Pseudomonas]|jgi:hypothetical protein|uniref:hypothetical protein n=1 Tax=unclassified Pseudomonas TaxID=196821 RepID=UPI0010316174|nr:MULTISPECIES: hypothetical protein [unclassified Pseudomonas]